MPIAVWEAITTDPTLNALGIDASTVFEMQSLDSATRPGVHGHFVVIDFQEQGVRLGGARLGPRVMDIAVHVPDDITRSYTQINRILNGIDSALLPMEQVSGSDGTRVTCIHPMGRSRNLLDAGWQTVTRAAQYSLLYDDLAL